VLIRGTASHDDPRLRDYWQTRAAAKAKDLTPSSQKIAQNQGYVCLVCGDSLFNGEEVHVHHKVPRARGGKDTYSNLRLVHLYCHHHLHSDTVSCETDAADEFQIG